MRPNMGKKIVTGALNHKTKVYKYILPTCTFLQVIDKLNDYLKSRI